MSLDLTAAASILKETYPDGVVELDYKKSKFLALLQKNKGTLQSSPFGAHFNVPVKYGNPQAGSGDYATGYAEASTESTRYKSWAVTPGEAFQFARINGSAIRRGEGVGSFVKMVVGEIENAKSALQRQLEIMLFRAGWGLTGQIKSGSATSGAATTLAYPWQARMFEIGESLVASASINAATLRSATALKVVGRNPVTGVITLSAAGNTQSMAADDYLFRIGDRQNSSSPTAIVPMGLDGWLPQSAPGATTFYSVDRTADTRLGGLRHDAANSGNMEEALLDLSALIDAEGGSSTHCVMGPDTYNKLVKSLLNKTYVDITTDDPKIGFKGIMIQGASGDITCFSDSACPEGIAYMFDISEIELRYAGKDLVTIDETDGLMVRKVAGADDFMADLVTCCSLIVPAPGHAGVVYGL